MSSRTFLTNSKPAPKHQELHLRAGLLLVATNRMVTVANGSTYGGGMKVAPRAHLQSG
jgi:hypothetical protein